MTIAKPCHAPSSLVVPSAGRGLRDVVKTPLAVDGMALAGTVWNRKTQPQRVQPRMPKLTVYYRCWTALPGAAMSASRKPQFVKLQLRAAIAIKGLSKPTMCLIRPQLRLGCETLTKLTVKPRCCQHTFPSPAASERAGPSCAFKADTELWAVLAAPGQTADRANRRSRTCTSKSLAQSACCFPDSDVNVGVCGLI